MKQLVLSDVNAPEDRRKVAGALLMAHGPVVEWWGWVESLPCLCLWLRVAQGSAATGRGAETKGSCAAERSDRAVLPPDSSEAGADRVAAEIGVITGRRLRRHCAERVPGLHRVKNVARRRSRYRGKIRHVRAAVTAWGVIRVEDYRES
jgi:hypothetical protein